MKMPPNFHDCALLVNNQDCPSRQHLIDINYGREIIEPGDNFYNRATTAGLICILIRGVCYDLSSYDISSQVIPML